MRRSLFTRAAVLFLVALLAQSVQVLFGFHTCSGTLDVHQVKLSLQAGPNVRTLAPGVVETDYNGVSKMLKVDGVEWSNIPDKDPTLSQELVLTEAERRRGIVIYQRANTMIAPAFTKPERREILERSQAVEMFLCPGETRSAVVILHPLKALPSVSFAFEALNNEKGNAIPAKSLRADFVETMVYRANWYRLYARMPRLIKRFEKRDLPADNGSQFWIYCGVPENATAGIYKGKARILSDGKPIGEIGLQVNVYPFKLDPTPVHWSFYYYYSPDASLYDELNYMQQLGMNSVIYSPPATSIFSRLKIENGKPTFDFSPDDEFMATYKKAGYKAPVVYYPRLLLLRLVQLLGLDKPFQTAGILGATLPLIKNEKDYPPQACDSYKQVIRLIVDHARQAKWPEIILYLTDEPSLGSSGEWETSLSYRLAKEARPKVKTFCTAYDPAFIRKYGKYINYSSCQGLHCAAPRLKNKDMLAACHETNSTLWASCWPGLWWHNYWYARAYAGLVCARSGFQGMNIWYLAKPSKPSTSSPRDPYWSLRPGTDNELANCGLGIYQMNERGDMESTTVLEGLREGILDYRYIATLRNAINAAKKKGREVRGYERELEQILASAPSLPVSDLSYYCDTPGQVAPGWSVEKNEKIRERIAEMIIRIQ